MFLLLVLGGAVYFLPSIIAGMRNHPSIVAIVLLNTLAGWTFIGWLVSLIWSVINQPTASVPPVDSVVLSQADELNKLAILLEKGYITQDEFTTQKQRVLSK
jgi:hypothetical protein